MLLLRHHQQQRTQHTGIGCINVVCLFASTVLSLRVNLGESDVIAAAYVVNTRNTHQLPELHSQAHATCSNSTSA
jgi:hypothetical protein